MLIYSTGTKINNFPRFREKKAIGNRTTCEHFLCFFTKTVPVQCFQFIDPSGVTQNNCVNLLVCGTGFAETVFPFLSTGIEAPQSLF